MGLNVEKASVMVKFIRRTVTMAMDAVACIIQMTASTYTVAKISQTILAAWPAAAWLAAAWTFNTQAMAAINTSTTT